MKLARIILASAAVLSVAACSSDRITSPARPAAPPTSIHASITPSDSTTSASGSTSGTSGTVLEVCTTATTVVNGVTTIVTTCDNGTFGSGQ